MPFLSPDFWRGLAALVYLLVAALVVLATFITIWRANPKNKWAWAWVPILILGFAYPPASAIYGKWRDEREFAAKSAAQIAHFEMRCKSAGEKIYQTVKGVDGIFIMKPRIVSGETLYQSQWELWDPYGTDGGEARTPAIFLFAIPSYAQRSGGVSINGFKFIETLNGRQENSKSKYIRFNRVNFIDPTDSLDWLLKKNTTQEFSDALQSRFGMTWADISSKEDREKWIAGGRLQVIELASGQVIAERVGYMREPGLGSASRNRSAWLFASRYACPAFISDAVKDRDFLAKVFPQQETKQ